MTYEDFTNKFLPELNNIRSFRGRINYANENLPRLGSGSGRIVYDIDGEKVLKLAKNSKGIAQNGEEVTATMYKDYDDILADVIDNAGDDSWIVAEKGKKLTKGRFREITGFDVNDVGNYLMKFHAENRGRQSYWRVDPEVEQKMHDDEEFVQRLTYFISDYGQSAGDMGRISTYGEVMKDGVPSVVLVDYGLNDEVYDSHYSPTRKRRVYEIYDLNDDAMDISDNEGFSIRRGIWALMPDGVGDGDEPINENFVSFVSKRNEYPTKPISNINFLTEEFYNCVNNLRNVLSSVDNPLQFYKNLLSLQDYLISNNQYNRDELVLVEDGTAKFSTVRSIGSDNFPPYDQDNLDEDLEYNHASDATADIYELTERVLHYVKGSKGVEVKKKCKLAGKGNTSDACNQGDINNLEFRSLKENM